MDEAPWTHQATKIGMDGRQLSEIDSVHDLTTASWGPRQWTRRCQLQCRHPQRLQLPLPIYISLPRTEPRGPCLGVH